MRKTMIFVAASLALAGCANIQSARLSDGGSGYVGKPATALTVDKGAPARQMTSPGGATVYVYQAHDLVGITFCEASFFVRDGKVVGFAAHGMSLTCGGTKGDTT
jgi:hypothetical protein